MLKFISILLLIAFSGLRAELSPTLVECKNTCECPSPYLPLESTFKTFKSSARLAQCGLDLSLIMKNMDCLKTLGIGPSKACSLEGALEGEQCFEKSPLPHSYNPSLSAPKGCGYKWRGFGLAQYKRIVQEYLTSDTIRCAPSMCTSAAFLALASKAKALYQRGQLSSQQYRELTIPEQKGYVILNANAEPNQLVEAYGIGSGHIQYIQDKELGTNGVPAAGDLVQIWRKNSSGHSVVFKGFVDKDGDGEPELLCYWSSQPSTEGYGDRCETTSDMDRILIGHFK